MEFDLKCLKVFAVKELIYRVNYAIINAVTVRKEGDRMAAAVKQHRSAVLLFASFIVRIVWLSGHASEINDASGLFDEAIDHRQAKARALAFALGREKRLEHLFDDLGTHAAAGNYS